MNAPTKEAVDVRALLVGTTPGPWEVRATIDGPLRNTDVRDSRGLFVARCGPMMGRRYAEGASANARLCAAAPQLALDNIAKDEVIAELREALTKARNTLSGCGLRRIAADICDAALAKAAGQ